VPTGSEASAFDAAAREAGVPGPVLMESAGRAAADVAMAWWSEQEREGPVRVLAGAGNNGGDAVVVARTLRARGLEVELFVDPRRPCPDPLLHGHDVPTWTLEEGGLGGNWTGEADSGRSVALVVDGLLGTGLSSAPRGPVACWLRELDARVREAGIPVLALDLPSGVVADTGQVPGVVLSADLTVAFGAPKLGTLLHPGRAHAGRLVVVEMGFPPWSEADASAALVTGAWARAHLPRRELDTHKNAVGRLLLVAGGEEMGGAAVLSARAALRTGVGMLRVLCAPRHRELFHHHVPEAILPDPGDADQVRAALEASDAVAAGPGMGLDPGASPARLLGVLLREAERLRVADVSDAGPPRPFLLDADALTLLGRGELPPLPGRDPDRHLLTPHPGELARILAGDPVPAHAPAAARAAAVRWQAVVLLKGAPSVVATPAGAPLWISASGGSFFARGGMGDVLTGVAGALLARGMVAREAAALALHLTGRAADHALQAGYAGDALLPSDLVDGLPRVLAEVGGERRASGADDPRDAPSDPVEGPTAGSTPAGAGPRLDHLPAVILDLAAPR
jgi:ADP-dependent NAD(P)H-hydrate dehydratase / NAD(P)H-hydrate epimerase